MSTMDFFTLMWGPVWFVIDLVLLGAEFYYFYKWIRAGITDTRDAVIAELEKPETAGLVGKAIGPAISKHVDFAPIREAVQDLEGDIMCRISQVEARIPDIGPLTEKVDHIVIPDIGPLTEKVDHIVIPDIGYMLDQNRKELDKKLAELDMSVDEDKLSAKIIEALQRTEKGLAGVDAREDLRQKKQFMEEYMAGQGAIQDARMIQAQLVRFGVPPNLAQAAAALGPSAVRWTLEEVLGKSEARKIITAYRQGQTAVATMR